LPWEDSLAAADPTPQAPVASPDDLLNEVDAAAVAGVSRKTIRKLIEEGRLQAIDYGTKGSRHYRIKREALANVSPRPKKPAPPPRQRTRNVARPSASATKMIDLMPSV
jgi:excisionase family DNA binding protein